jgi:hypothetical protein
MNSSPAGMLMGKNSSDASLFLSFIKETTALPAFRSSILSLF